MKFELLYEDELKADLGKTSISRAEIDECLHCHAMTSWVDDVLKENICSEECCEARWQCYFENNPDAARAKQSEVFRDQIAEEASVIVPQDASKDILIVVHNQLDYVKQCIQSIQEHTNNYHIYIWDNGSDDETKLI